MTAVLLLSLSIWSAEDVAPQARVGPSAIKPAGLPILAQPVKDRAPLLDPTLETSIAAALAKINLNRANPAPFQPINLPDPFEHSQAIRLRYPPEELPTPPPITPRWPIRP
jgi:hypothetical protein